LQTNNYCIQFFIVRTWPTGFPSKTEASELFVTVMTNKSYLCNYGYAKTTNVFTNCGKFSNFVQTKQA